MRQCVILMIQIGGSAINQKKMIQNVILKVEKLFSKKKSWKVTYDKKIVQYLCEKCNIY